MTSRLAYKSKIVRSLALLLPCVTAFAACERPQYTYSDDVPVKGVGARSSVGGGIVAGSTFVAGSSNLDPCALGRSVGEMPIFAKQALSNQPRPQGDLFLEVDDTEASALKHGASLLPPASNDKPASALTALLTEYLSQPIDTNRPLFEALLTRFQNTRAIWPNPWALRLIEHPGSEHMNPVRIVLKPEAWIVRLVDGMPTVVDLNNARVTLEQAVAEPERIAAVFYVIDDLTAIGLAGSQCENAKRELALGNEAMVASFELGTPGILARLNSDIDALNAFFNVVRPCGSLTLTGGTTFHQATACQTWHYFDATTEYTAYQWSLSNPVELYKPTAQNLSSLIVALQNDRFEPQAFVGVPQPSPGAAGDSAGGQGAGGMPDQNGTAGLGGI